MAGKIFVNYRRGDARDGAARLRDKLAATLGDADVFMDVDNLLAGERFDLKLQEALAATEVFLAVIGAHWMELLEARAASGERDFVREEIAAALAAGIPVIPVTMDRAPLPKPASLPEDIRDLVLYHKHDIAYESFGRDVEALIEAIETHRRARQEQKARREAEGLAREQAAAEAARRAAEQQRQESDAARLARERETAEAARLAYERGRADAEARRAKEKEQEEARRRTRAESAAGTPWKPVAAGIAAVAAIVLAIVYWPNTPALVPHAPVRYTVRAEPEDAACNGGIRVSVGLSVEKTCIKPGSGKAFRDCLDCPEMVVVPVGSFTMGSSTSEELPSNDESPQHEVRISKPFAVGQFAVTFAEWDACVDDGGCGGYRPSDQGWGRGDQPVINVNWDDAKAYVAWIKRKTGKEYRLLSEAEREYVARAGTTTPFWWGPSISTRQANYDGTFGKGQKGEYRQKTLPVKSFERNPWGLYQVHGNVWEWVEDCWHDSYHNAPSDGSAWTTGDCGRRIVRGGSWENTWWDLRAARHGNSTPVGRYSNIGLRVARTFNASLLYYPLK